MTKEKDKNKETKVKLLSKIGDNIKRIFRSVWNIIKTSIGYAGKGLTVPAIFALATVAIVLITPVLIVVISSIILLELFKPDEQESVFNKAVDAKVTS